MSFSFWLQLRLGLLELHFLVNPSVSQFVTRLQVKSEMRTKLMTNGCYQVHYLPALGLIKREIHALSPFKNLLQSVVCLIMLKLSTLVSTCSFGKLLSVYDIGV